jgi:hypothetical protein
MKICDFFSDIPCFAINPSILINTIEIQCELALIRSASLQTSYCFSYYIMAIALVPTGFYICHGDFVVKMVLRLNISWHFKRTWGVHNSHLQHFTRSRQVFWFTLPSRLETQPLIHQMRTKSSSSLLMYDIQTPRDTLVVYLAPDRL